METDEARIAIAKKRKERRLRIVRAVDDLCTWHNWSIKRIDYISLTGCMFFIQRPHPDPAQRKPILCCYAITDNEKWSLRLKVQNLYLALAYSPLECVVEDHLFS